MAEAIDLRSTEFLREARDSLGQAGRQIDGQAEAAREMVRRVQQDLESIGLARLEELRDAQRALDAVDEDDSGWDERRRRDEAYEAVQQFRRVASAMDDAGRRFVARVGVLSDRGRQLAHAAIASLDRRIEALDEYASIHVPDAEGRAVANGVGAQARPGAGVSAVTGPLDSSLPPGFGWVDISEIDNDGGFIDDPAEFRKVGHAEMRRGLEILRDEIIPALRDRGSFTREDAELRDREGGTAYTEAGWIHPESRLTVWHAFLDPRREADVVVVEREADGKYRVSSGRHRLGLARQLGLQAIPARILGAGNGA